MVSVDFPVELSAAQLADCVVLGLANHLAHAGASRQNSGLPDFGGTFVISLLYFVEHFIFFLTAASSEAAAFTMSVITQVVLDGMVVNQADL